MTTRAFFKVYLVLIFVYTIVEKHSLNPEITLLYKCHAQKALFKIPKICNINFWVENDPPPFGTFPKIHPIWRSHPSLRSILFWPRGTQKTHILQVQVISLNSQTIGHDNDFTHIPHLVLTLNYAETCPYILQVHPLPPIITSWACLSPLCWGCDLSPSQLGLWVRQQQC